MADLFNNTGADFSPCGQYRYRLWRRWDDSLPILIGTLQNPSVADSIDNDPTITRVLGFARRDGFGAIVVYNVFAMRATDEKRLLDRDDPVGPLNLEYLRAITLRPGDRLLVAWGKRMHRKTLHKHYDDAEKILIEKGPYCLGVNKDGSPRHPLFLRDDTEMVPWVNAFKR